MTSIAAIDSPVLETGLPAAGSVTVVLDHKFILNANGDYCALTMFGPTFWQRYLRAFKSVKIVCRARPALKEEGHAVPVKLPNVEFAPVPYYEGMGGLLKRYHAVSAHLRSALDGSGSIILRAPQLLPAVAYPILRRKGIPYGVEVVGDPWDLYAPGAETHVLRPVIRRFAYYRLKAICANAVATSYVTRTALQERYPPKEGFFSTHASSVELDGVVEASRKYDRNAKAWQICFVGAMNRLYKGQDVLIKALAICRQQFNLEMRLLMVGGGQFVPNLQSLASRLGVEPWVKFTGPLPRGNAVAAVMDQSDLFVLPSRQEGLPRSVIEAMSRALPCIASNVGGNRELLDAEWLVSAGDEHALAERIRDLVLDPEEMERQSTRNLKTAEEYVATRIEPRRQAFYSALRTASEAGHRQE